ncbi:unnamed protein product [Rotaria sp. Silwood2]|nr:unnamed protein product [Rotaria sp. Silwood2]CAF4334503.1 unnamed protein product [Rotaria sp. Silwood2]CAF4462697.1 unnamed protein product [Rotaria sp. Silwood2]CAF4636545.1 unnamed protein product [Rotaria sp. Silwood2]
MLTKIVGGESAGTATWGWTVSISIADRYLCGGSILSSSWIITAAHCVKDAIASEITIYAGSNFRWVGSESRVVLNVHIHPNYSSVGYVNDIALLRLTSPLTMNDPNLSTICLNFVNSTVLMTEEWPPANTTVVAVGWGTLNGIGSSPTNLQQVSLEIIDRRASTCNNLLHDWQVQLCAGVPNGNKGGPFMMFTSNKQWVLVGITSNGIGCGQAEYSGVYTRVAAYEYWINSTINVDDISNNNNNM